MLYNKVILTMELENSKMQLSSHQTGIEFHNAYFYTSLFDFAW